jgi:hypothetical protein
MKPIVLFLVILSGILVVACGPKVSGNTMETENSVAFQIVLPDGKAAARMTYRIRTSSYLSDAAKTGGQDTVVYTGETDKSGWFRAVGLPIGSYVVELVNGPVGAVLSFTHRDTVGPEVKYQLILDTLGAVQGRVALPSGISYAWVQVYGLETAVKTDKSGNFLIPKLPVGSIRLIAWHPSVTALLGEVECTVVAGDTLGLGLLSAELNANEDPSTWNHSRPLSTAELVPDWMRPLKFPAVVNLYLDSENFAFDEALANGSDIRVFTASGKSLATNRARWDVQAKRAVVRIRIDDASDTLDALDLRWGKLRAADPGKPDLWKGVSDTLWYAWNTVRVDDFEDSTNQNALPSPIAVGYWFRNKSDSATMSPGPKDAYTMGLAPAGLGRTGQSYHVRYTAAVPEWVLIGTTLADEPKSLYTMDSIVVWARGNGSISIAFENNGGDTIGRKAWKHIPLDTVWTRYMLRPSDLMAPDTIGGNVGWDVVRDSVTNISIFGSNGTDLWVDDVRLYGINREDLR